MAVASKGRRETGRWPEPRDRYSEAGLDTASSSSGSTERAIASGSAPPPWSSARRTLRSTMAIDASATSDADTRNAAGIAPLAMVLALWLGALAALLAVPSMDRRRRWWTGPLGAVGLAAMAGLVAAGLMVAGLDLAVGLAIARLPLLVAVCLLAAAAFAMIVGALAAAFGLRGWVAALLLAGLGVAASGYPSGVDALPGPLALIRPLLPTSWAVDAIRACIESARSSVALDAAVLVGWLIVGAMVVLAVTVGRRGGVRAPADRRSRDVGPFTRRRPCRSVRSGGASVEAVRQ